MESKFDGFCKACKRKIYKGDEIKRDNNIWIHVDCSAGNISNFGNQPRQAYQPYQTQKALPSGPAGSIEGALSIFQVPEAMVIDSQSTYDEKPFTPSPYQLAIFDFILNGTGNAVIEAVAGSGKTTTIVNALKLTNPESKVAFLAFNKHIAAELKSRSPEHVHVSTIHSLGMSQIRRCYGNVTVDDDKVGYILEQMFPVSKYKKTQDGKSDLLIGNKRVEIPYDERTKNRQKRLVMRKLVALSKATLVDYSNSDSVLSMCERYGIEAGEDWLSFLELIDKLPEVMAKCFNHDTIDFDDMVWLPVADSRLALHSDKFDWVFVDEGQDLNANQTAFVLNLLRAGGRVIIVGDRRQSLYGFRGADVQAIPNMIIALDAKVLPLSISYRCPRLVVELAKEIVPGIEAAPNAIEGTVEPMKWKTFLATVQPGDMVLCRTNAPLIKPAFEVIKSGRKAIIRGKDIGKALVNYIERFQAADLTTLEVLMAESTEKEVNRYLDDGKELLADTAKDRFETILTVSKECRTVEELIGKIELMFDDGNRGVIFSSIHKAKGLEANRVFILHNELMPHPKAKRDWEKVQEMNGKYVAITRSKDALYLVENEEVII